MLLHVPNVWLQLNATFRLLCWVSAAGTGSLISLWTLLHCGPGWKLIWQALLLLSVWITSSSCSAEGLSCLPKCSSNAPGAFIKVRVLHWPAGKVGCAADWDMVSALVCMAVQRAHGHTSRKRSAVMYIETLQAAEQQELACRFASSFSLAI